MKRGRLARLVRNAALAAAIGGAASVPLAIPQAEARSFLTLPALKVPTQHPGYQLATDTGDVLPFGAAASGTAPVGLANPVIGVARTKTGAGSWTATADGGVITSGDAPFYGSLGGQHLNRPIVGLAATPSGTGYWLVSADGGVFTFGDAGFFGSPVGQPINAPVVALTPTGTGDGYWLATGDGGVFTYGDALFYGSVDRPLQGWVTSMAATPSGQGYWLASVDGGVFTFGDALYFGRPDPVALHAPVVGIAASRSGQGYWLASAEGGVYTFGDAPFLGSSAGKGWGRVVGITAGAGRPMPKALQAIVPRIRNRFGHDISWPQCGDPVPAPGYGFGVIGVTSGHPFSTNRCLAEQWRWATSGGAVGAVYVNLASPYYGEAAAMHGPAGDCTAVDLPCQTYNHSANNITDALSNARAAGVDSPMWWLDVEVLNHWSGNDALNALTVRAAAETLQHAGLRAGVYSTALMWRTITGGDRNGLPVWIAGAPTDADAPAWCDRPDKNFTGGGIWLVQALPIVFDVNYACDPALADPTGTFRFEE